MTEVTTTFEQPPDAGPAPSAATVPSKPEQTLITEQQVLFSTSAAVALPVKARRFTDAVRAVVGSVRTWLVSAAQPPAQRRYPKQYVWLENSLMSREMDRL